jgi:S1-C subfamily serine protease
MSFKNAAEKVFPHVVGLSFAPKLVFELPQEEKLLQFGVGTGVLLGPSGHVLTARHVLPSPGWKLFFATNPPNIIPRVALAEFAAIAEFPEHDLAILKIGGPEVDLSFLNDFKQPKFSFETPYYGTPLGSFGYPIPRIRIDQTTHNIGPETELKFKSFYVAAIHGGPETKYLVLDSFAYGGHSGGPVFDRDGRVLGIVVRSELDNSGQSVVSYSHASLIANIRAELSEYLY